jgi:hypothetical protein
LDRKIRDPSRIEYFLIGPAYLTIDRFTGDIFLTGDLDAEMLITKNNDSEPIIPFKVYARDISPKPLSIQSDFFEFTLIVGDENEFRPTIEINMPFLQINETIMTNDIHMDAEINEYQTNILKNLKIKCEDRDLSAKLHLNLDSVRYVNGFNTELFIDDIDARQNKRIDLERLFKLKTDNATQNQINVESYKNVIREKSAHLELIAPIDYEKLYDPSNTLIRLDITCSDGRFRASSKFLIRVLDMNDNKPEFVFDTLPEDAFINFEKQLIEVNIKELRYFTHNIMTVAAHDADFSPNFGQQSLVYSLNCLYNVKYNMRINDKTGLIFAVKNEYEENEQFQDLTKLPTSPKDPKVFCKVTVKDSFGENKWSTKQDVMDLIVNFQTVNDNAPVIEIKGYSDSIIEITEGPANRGKELKQIRVTDRDDASNLRCVFGASGLEHQEPFVLSTDFKNVDRNQRVHEAWCILSVQPDKYVSLDATGISFYNLEIVVEDLEHPVLPNLGRSSVPIVVYVKGVNNFPPSFINGEDEKFFILDSHEPNTLITTLLAIDEENPGNNLYYKIMDSDDSFRFKIVNPSIQSSAKSKSVGVYLGEEHLPIRKKPYMLTVRCYDGPIDLTTTLSAEKKLFIYVINKGSVSVWVDSTTGEPIDYYRVDLIEKTQQDHLLITIQANLPLNSNAKNNNNGSSVRYYIENDIGTNVFYKINNTNGEIRTTSVGTDCDRKSGDVLSHDSILMRQIRVRANSSDNFYSYITYVNVNLIDINDNAPQFESQMNEFSIPENAMSSSSQHDFELVNNKSMIFIGKIKATDCDSDPKNNEIKYKIVEDDQHLFMKHWFYINETTGALYLKESLDREQASFIDLNVIAFNRGKI